MKTLKRLPTALLKRIIQLRGCAARWGICDPGARAVEDGPDGPIDDGVSGSCDTTGRRYATLYESEMRVIAGISAESAAAGLEGGGELYGLISQGERIVVFLVTAPSPHATRRTSFFRQDPQFLRRTNNTIGRALGLQLDGTHHHHTMDLPRPSDFDVQQVRSFTARNNFRSWLQIITTVHNGHVSRPFGRPQRSGARQRDFLRIALHAFLFTDPQRGVKVEVPIRVIRGTSPMRLSAVTGGVLDPADIGQSYGDFPMDRIVYNAFDFDAQYPKLDALIPESLALAEQFQELPEEVQHDLQIRVRTGRDLVTVMLPLPDGSTASVAYQRRPTHLIESISLAPRDNGLTEDRLSALFVGKPNVSLTQVYEALLSKTREATEDVGHLESGDPASEVLQEQGQCGLRKDRTESRSALDGCHEDHPGAAG